MDKRQDETDSNSLKKSLPETIKLALEVCSHPNYDYPASSVDPTEIIRADDSLDQRPIVAQPETTPEAEVKAEKVYQLLQPPVSAPNTCPSLTPPNGRQLEVELRKRKTDKKGSEGKMFSDPTLHSRLSMVRRRLLFDDLTDNCDQITERIAWKGQPQNAERSKK